MATLTRPRPVRVGLCAAALSTMLLTGCSATGSGSTAASTGQPQSQREAGPAADASAPDHGFASGPKAAPGADPLSVAGSTLTEPTVAVTRKLARAAELTIRVAAIETSSAGVRKVAADLGGYVANEQIGTPDKTLASAADETLGGHAVLTISVPATQIDSALRRLAHLGAVTQRSMTSTDVTKQLIDTSSRVKTMQASVDRLRALMTQTKDVKQITNLESALTTREATLESLTAQLASVTSSVAMSTITVTLSTTATPAKAEAPAPHGFLGGLAAGWHGLVVAVVAVLTALGMVLPFLLPVVLVALPAALVLRRRRRPTAPLADPGLE